MVEDSQAARGTATWADAEAMAPSAMAVAAMLPVKDVARQLRVRI